MTLNRTVVKWFGRKASEAERRGAARGLQLGGFHIEEEASRIVPIDEGTLLRSSWVDVDERELRCAVSYDTPYAVRQHEELTWQHEEGRQAKYLETPINDPENKRKVEALIAREIKAELTKEL